MSVLSEIKSNPRLKKVALWMLSPSNEYRPRLWVKLFLNPFIHKRGSGSIIRSRTKMDLFPQRNFKLGALSVIEDFTIVNNAVGDVIIGTESFIGAGNVIIGPVDIADHVMTAQNVVISGMNHSYTDIHTPPTKQKVTIGKITIAENVWIGANTVVTAGVSIGKHSVIGAGSVVTKNVPDYSVAVGNPIRIIKKYNQETSLWERV